MLMNMYVTNRSTITKKLQRQNLQTYSTQSKMELRVLINSLVMTEKWTNTELDLDNHNYMYS